MHCFSHPPTQLCLAFTLHRIACQLSLSLTTNLIFLLCLLLHVLLCMYVCVALRVCQRAISSTECTRSAGSRRSWLTEVHLPLFCSVLSSVLSLLCSLSPLFCCPLTTVSLVQSRFVSSRPVVTFRFPSTQPRLSTCCVYCFKWSGLPPPPAFPCPAHTQTTHT